MQFRFAFTDEGAIGIFLDRKLVKDLLALYDEYEGSENQMHRTPVEDVEADIFDRLEVEIANDKVAEAAATAANMSNLAFADDLRQQLADEARGVLLLIASPERYTSALMWFNSLYTFARRGEVEGFTVGTAQTDDDISSYSVPLLTRNLMSIVSILADLGINAYRVIAELGEE